MVLSYINESILLSCMTNGNDSLFPYETVRPFQREMVECITNCLEKKQHAIIHAPTGMGKTVSTLAPALAYAVKHKKIVFFLTSRHTQHHIVIDTLKEIKQKYNPLFSVADIIGKKWMCLQSAVTTLSSGDFLDYCKSLREQRKCRYYEFARNGQRLTPGAAALVDALATTPLHLDDVMSECRKEEVCPYEIAIAQSARATVIVADYNYLFNPPIRNAFLAKIRHELKDCIIIVDEAHNLPMRMRELQSHKLSTITIHKAMREAKKYRCIEALPLLEKLHNTLFSLGENKEEIVISKELFLEKVNGIMDRAEMIDLLESFAETVRVEQKTSALGSIAVFLEGWPSGDEGFVRILTTWKSKMGEIVYTLSKKGLDPSFVTREPIRDSHCTIMMSGTMTPTSMYRELLGFPEHTTEHIFSSSFPSKNRCVIVVPETSTRYSTRSPSMYKRIAVTCVSIINQIPGNCALFFPSYAIRDNVASVFTSLCNKTIFAEMPTMQKSEKKELLERFREYKSAVLLAISSGNFAEGIDLPGVLKCVIVVGLPLQPPNLEMKHLIAYYDRLFRKGWDYGYIFPAFSKCIQSAGRAIRTEKDRSVLIFLDERFLQHRRFFPSDWEITVTSMYGPIIQSFFENNNN